MKNTGISMNQSAKRKIRLSIGKKFGAPIRIAPTKAAIMYLTEFILSILPFLKLKYVMTSTKNYLPYFRRN